MGYELGSRLAVALHATTPDYHTSGAWVAVAAAAAGARLLKLDTDQTAHALGIAEYHGPRSQMMRCIDHPTMLKDGSGWGAMAGVSAALLARAGLYRRARADDHRACRDLGRSRHPLADPGAVFQTLPGLPLGPGPGRGRAGPASRAQPDQPRHRDASRSRPSTNRPASPRNEPKTTEEAQYSTSFPTAVALVRGAITPADIADEALSDPEILRLSRAMTMVEDDHANAHFPSGRLARVTLTLRDGTELHSGWTSPRWDAAHPPTEAELRAKYHDLADPALGAARAHAIESALHDLPARGLTPLADLICQPISRATTSARAS